MTTAFPEKTAPCEKLFTQKPEHHFHNRAMLHPMPKPVCFGKNCARPSGGIITPILKRDRFVVRIVQEKGADVPEVFNAKAVRKSLDRLATDAQDLVVELLQ